MTDTPNETVTPAILLVDDDEPTLRSVARALRSHGMENLVLCQDSRRVPELVEQHRVSAVLLDVVMPHVGGEEVLEGLLGRDPDLPVIMVTGEDDVDTAVRCMKRGAMDYLVKPMQGDRLVAAVHLALEHRALREEAARLRERFCADRPQSPEAFKALVTADPAMLRLFAYLEAVSRGSQPVLITGETGTGKELLARALHAASERPGPFVAVNVAGLDDTMFSDTLFGHRSGAFTGATAHRGGMIEQAGQGTLFLDEIGDLPEASQVKLLRLVQEREYYPLGSDTSRPLLARVVAATQQDPEKLRTDLYYRLRLYHAKVPPLRDRLGDIPLLVEHFLGLAAHDLGKPKPEVSPELYVYLESHDFPGNVRELLAMVFDAVARSDGEVVATDAFVDLPTEVTPESDATTPAVRFPVPLPSLRAIEQSAIEEALRRVNGNQSAAARMLRVSRSTVARHQAKFDADA